MEKNQNYINHIVFVLDASSSMTWNGSDKQLVKVADAQIAYLAQRSKDLDQETRVTVYSFADQVKCLIYDKDVLRLPSIASLYKAHGDTALISATLKALDDLSKTPELYGEHAFLVYVLTDGEENASRRINGSHTPGALEAQLKVLPDHWTVATFVPNQRGVFEAKKFGFPKDNIAVWDANTKVGVESAGEVIKQATENFMQARKKGVRGFKNLFNMDTTKLDSENLSKLQKLHFGQFRLYDVPEVAVIAPFVEKQTQRPYKLGEAYYQLVKPEKIQPQKQIVIYHKKEHAAYAGADARKILGLPDHEVRVSPAQHPDIDIYPQSSSVNRKLPAGSKVLLMSN